MTLDPFEKIGDLRKGEDRAILADIFIAHVAAGALAQATLHLILQCR